MLLGLVLLSAAGLPLLRIGAVIFAAAFIALVIEIAQKKGWITSTYLYYIFGFSMLLIFYGLIEAGRIPLVAFTGETLIDTALTAAVAAATATLVSVAIQYLMKKKGLTASVYEARTEWIE